MSGESKQHTALVEHLIALIRSEHATRHDLLVLADHHSFGKDRPPKIGGFTPDVFASNIPETFRILGEAKTPRDLESERSSRQVAAFLDHLALRPPSTLYLAVPWLFLPRAQDLIRSIRKDSHAGVQIHVITDISQGR